MSSSTQTADHRAFVAWPLVTLEPWCPSLPPHGDDCWCTAERRGRGPVMGTRSLPWPPLSSFSMPRSARASRGPPSWRACPWAPRPGSSASHVRRLEGLFGVVLALEPRKEAARGGAGRGRRASVAGGNSRAGLAPTTAPAAAAKTLATATCSAPALVSTYAMSCMVRPCNAAPSATVPCPSRSSVTTSAGTPAMLNSFHSPP